MTGVGVCLSRAGVIGCDDEEQVCMMSNQVQVKVISDGGYGPFCDTKLLVTSYCPTLLVTQVKQNKTTATMYFTVY